MYIDVTFFEDDAFFALFTLFESISQVLYIPLHVLVIPTIFVIDQSNSSTHVKLHNPSSTPSIQTHICCVCLPSTDPPYTKCHIDTSPAPIFFSYFKSTHHDRLLSYLIS